ncbi:hypothetical protein B7486_16525 [cyanobacterium TDX16]|nr:hypothetical protein B7486_16525 [cyanobacterium TDX16]
MDKAKKENVNWSALACRAFEEELGRIAARKESKAMADVVQRLRASAISTASEMSRLGFEAGEAWAKNKAEAAELRRLSDHAERVLSCSQLSASEMFSVGGSAFSPGQQFAMVVLGEDQANRHQADEFWNDVGLGGDEPNDGDFIGGFTEGALHVWREVENMI